MANLQIDEAGRLSKHKRTFGTGIAAAPEAVHHYLAHTGAGMSIRDLARLLDCHASTMSRRIQRIEQSRDDPLVDAALRRLENRVVANRSDYLQRLGRGGSVMPTPLSDRDDLQTDETFEKEAMRVLRRLCETGAVLAIAKDMDMAVVVRESADGAVTRTAVVSQDVAQAIALQGWIETTGQGRILRYVISAAGRDRVKELIDRHAPMPEPGSYEMSEAPATFDPAPTLPGAGARDEDSDTRKYRYNLAESPLVALSRRRDRDGQPFLPDDLVRSGERLREDFELAQMGPQVTQNWTKFLTGEVEGSAGVTAMHGYGPEAARARVVAALRELGPGLSDVALRCCCFLEGLESTEKRMGWSARSGKIVLRIALQRLKRHYDETLTADAQLIG